MTRLHLIFVIGSLAYLHFPTFFTVSLTTSIIRKIYIIKNKQELKLLSWEKTIIFLDSCNICHTCLNTVPWGMSQRVSQEGWQKLSENICREEGWGWKGGEARKSANIQSPLTFFYLLLFRQFILMRPQAFLKFSNVGSCHGQPCFSFMSKHMWPFFRAYIQENVPSSSWALIQSIDLQSYVHSHWNNTHMPQYGMGQQLLSQQALVRIILL